MQQRSSHVASITGLRAIAVLAVILFHLDPAWMPGGFVGVDIFFVISGFVVAHSVMERPSPDYRTFVAEFYRRRFARLYPALLAYVVVATLASVLLIPLVEQTRNFEKFGAAAALGLSNFMLMEEEGNYFAVSGDFNPFTHTWSLAVEEQYYLLFSLFAFPLLVRSSARARAWSLAIIAAAAAASLVLCAVMAENSPPFAFYMLPTRFWELALGLLLRIAMDRPGAARLAQLARPARETIAWGALLLLIWSCWTTAEAGFPFPGALLPCAATVALIAALWSWRDCSVSRVVASPVPFWIGLTSYSLYLWHWGVIVFMRWTVGVDGLALKLTALLVTFAFAAASYHWIERAFHHSRRTETIASPRFFVRFAATMGLTVWLCLWSVTVKPEIGLAAASRLDIWNPYGEPAGVRPCKARISIRAEGNGRFITIYAPCRKPGARNLFVLGDSHAAAYRRMLWNVAETGDWNVHLYTRNGCGYVNFRMAQRESDCEAFTEKALEEMRRLASKRDVVFLPSLQTSRYRNNWGLPEAPYYSSEINSEILGANQHRLAALTELRIPVIVEDAKPLMQIALFRCADWFNRHQTYCQAGASVDKLEMLERMRPPRSALQRIATGMSAVEIWDPTEVLCPGDRCEAWHQGKPLFFDVDHLSAYANDLLLPSFVNALERAQRPAEGRCPQWGVSRQQRS